MNTADSRAGWWMTKDMTNRSWSCHSH
jgi:hypothetical protein